MKGACAFNLLSEAHLARSAAPVAPPAQPRPLTPPFPLLCTPRLLFPLQVRALGKDAKHARLYELVDIFAHATLGAYLEYHGKNGAYLADLGIDHERSMETMRLLTLCTLASGNHKQTYDAIAAALQVRV